MSGENRATYNHRLHRWKPRCPFGDVCTGCDAQGYCSRMAVLRTANSVRVQDPAPGVPVCEVLGDRQQKDLGGGKSRPSEGAQGSRP